MRGGCAWVPGCQAQAVGHASLCVRHESRYGHGTAQESDACMDAPTPRFSLPTTGLSESSPRDISQSTDYAREAEEAVGMYPLAECHMYCTAYSHKSESRSNRYEASRICQRSIMSSVGIVFNVGLRWGVKLNPGGRARCGSCQRRIVSSRS